MENSSFGENNDKIPIISDIQQLNNNGATSDTYKVFISKKWYFLKRPKKDFATHPHYLNAFEKEYEIGASLNHPNIVGYIGKDTDNNGFYILTEYVEGLTLKDFVDENPNYFHNKKNLKKFTFQLLSALEYLHERQILHLDLKPDNILITKIGNDVKIVDLGFAYSDGHQYSTIGKSEKYAAPEQIRNEENIDQRADIYSLGILILFAYTRTHNKKLIDKLPKLYRNCVKKCLEENKNDRFENISSIKDYFSQKNKQQKVFIFSIVILLILMSSYGISQYVIHEKTVLDISKMDAPNDIMRKVTMETSLDYIKEQFGEPKTIDSNPHTQKTTYYWNFKNLELSITEMPFKELWPGVPLMEDEDPNKMERSEITYRLLGNADMRYDEILSNIELPNFGKATIGSYLDMYNYDGGLITWGNGKLFIDAGRYRSEINSFRIFIGGDALTNYHDYILSVDNWFMDKFDKTIQDKLIKSEGDISVLNNIEKRKILEVVKKLKITTISCGVNLEEVDYNLNYECHPFSVE